jgi:uncharacterized protein (TIGR02147 family)
MKVYEFDNYKEFLNKWISSQAHKGHGILSKIAKELRIHTTLLSHTIRGDKDLTHEQAFAIGQYIGLHEDEMNYFLLLVQIERAGHLGLKNKLKNDLQKLKSKSHDLSGRLPSDTELSIADKSQFYSSWLYSAIRQLSSIQEFQSRASLAEAFPTIQREVAYRIIDFLVESGLCKESSGKISIGPSNTHIESKSPLVFNHHKNWRLKGFEKHHNLVSEELMYTAPFTISEKDFHFLREKVAQLIELLIKTADQTKSERLACLNIDLFFVK